MGRLSTVRMTSQSGATMIPCSHGRITIEPRLDPRLTWAKTTYRGPLGTISTRWQREGDQLDLEVTIPANARAVVRPPAGATNLREGDRPAAEAEGVQLLDGSALSIGSGTYHFRMRLR